MYILRRRRFFDTILLPRMQIKRFAMLLLLRYHLLCFSAEFHSYAAPMRTRRMRALFFGARSAKMLTDGVYDAED